MIQGRLRGDHTPRHAKKNIHESTKLEHTRQWWYTMIQVLKIHIYQRHSNCVNALKSKHNQMDDEEEDYPYPWRPLWNNHLKQL